MPNAPSAVGVSLTSVSKTYLANRAVDHVSLSFEPGRIHALLGGNGAGKSTLVKMLAGVCRPDPGGTIQVGQVSAPSEQWDLSAARAAGVNIVHQDACVFPTMTVVENLGVIDGYGARTAGRIRWKSLRRQAQAVIDHFNIDASPDTLAGDLRPADQTLLAIGRVMEFDKAGLGSSLLILDEPTAALPNSEVNTLFDALRRSAAAGACIVFIGHRLGEILALADDITILRNGRVVHSGQPDQIDERRLAELIVGHELATANAREATVLDPSQLVDARSMSGGAVRDASVSLRAGEIVGIAGLLGSGRSSLLKLLFGVNPCVGGELVVNGRTVTSWNIGRARAAGFGYVPEDRAGEGTFAGLGLDQNLLAPTMRSYWRRLRMSSRAQRRASADGMRDFGVVARNVAQPIDELSGGNQQKVVVGRWLQAGSRVLLLDEPTQGVDAGARAELHNLIRAGVTAGAGAVVVSSDFRELTELCDRVVVMREGRVVAECTGPNLTEERLASLSLADTTGALIS